MDTFYKVVNPTNDDLTIMVKGQTYTLPASGSLDMIPEFVAKHWEGLHAFLRFEKMKSVPVSKLPEEISVISEVEIKEPMVEDVVELPEEETPSFITEEVEEIKEEKPVKKGKK